MSAKLELRKRHYGKHGFVKEMELPNPFEYYVNKSLLESRDDCAVDEEKLLADIPDGWLPQLPTHILLLAGDDTSSTGMMGTKHFKSWAKYFDAYSLTVTDLGLVEK